MKGFEYEKLDELSKGDKLRISFPINKIISIQKATINKSFAYPEIGFSLEIFKSEIVVIARKK